MRLQPIEPKVIYYGRSVTFVPRTESEFGILFGHGYGWEYPFGLFVKVPIIKDPHLLTSK